MTQLQKQYQNLLTLLQSFESLWIYYTVSEGELFRKECKEEAKKLVDYFEKVYQVDNGIYNSKTLTLNENDSEEQIREILRGLDEWSTSKDLFPNMYNGLGGDGHAKYLISSGFLMCEKGYLCQKLNLEIFPTIIWSSGQGAYNKNEIRWKGHLPWQTIELVSKDFVDNLSITDSIVIVADIRKSQDLMTYGPNPDFFRDKILEFTTQIRRIIKDNFGIFDKFTGDGFLCYFNSYLCEQFDIDYYEQMLIACRQIMEFSNPFFEEWSKHVRKLPPNSCGLTIGIDSGVIKFRDLDSHLFAIGDAIVWANRMSSAGKKEEIIFNNIPYFKVKESNSNVEFETIENITKGGEAFTAYKLIKM
jgi:Adenylate and Guanylate cyclase catalytic domain